MIDNITMLEMDLNDAKKRIDKLENEVKRLGQLIIDQTKINEGFLDIMKNYKI